MNRYAPPNARGNHRGPRLLKLLAAFFALYGLYCLWWAAHGWYWSGGFSAAMSFASTVGLWLGYRWSRYCVYLFSVMILCYFAWSIWVLVQMGWPYQDQRETVMAVVPGSVVLGLAIGAAVYVFRTFRSES